MSEDKMKNDNTEEKCSGVGPAQLFQSFHIDKDQTNNWLFKLKKI
jgi:hypothetical protein